jgi:hypothetical protein
VGTSCVSASGNPNMSAATFATANRVTISSSRQAIDRHFH